MWKSLGEYILSVSTKNPTKIVEIGVGRFSGVYDFLNSYNHIQIIKTDIKPADETVIEDDITNPDLKIYKNTDIIYSIRPPSELQPHIIKLANDLNTQLIIKTLFNEDLNSPIKMTLKNYKKASFYTF